jgi:hypothetical protein
MHSERETVRLIRDAVKRGTLIEPFTPADVNLAIGVLTPLIYAEVSPTGTVYWCGVPSLIHRVLPP